LIRTDHHIIFDVIDAAQGKSILGDLPPFQLSTRKSIQSSFSGFSMSFSADTDFRAVEEILPYRKRLLIRLARMPYDEKFGEYLLSCVVRGQNSGENYGPSASRVIIADGTCLNGLIANYNIFYNSQFLSGKDSLEGIKTEEAVTAALFSYFAFTQDSNFYKEDTLRPSSFIRNMMKHFETVVPAGESPVLSPSTGPPPNEGEFPTEILPLANSMNQDEGGNLSGCFGFDEDTQLIPWTEWVSDALTDMSIIQHTNLDGSLWGALEKLRFASFQMLWSDTHPVTARHELQYAKFPFRDAAYETFMDAKRSGLSDFTTGEARLDGGEIISRNMARDDTESFNLFWTRTAFSQALGHTYSSRVVGSVLFEGSHPSSIKRIGLREYAMDDPHAWIQWREANVTISRWQANWQEWNPLLYRGTMSIPIANRIRPGMTLTVRDDPRGSKDFPDFQCFVTSVSTQANIAAVQQPIFSQSVEFVRGIFTKRLSDDNEWWVKPVSYEEKTLKQKDSEVNK